MEIDYTSDYNDNVERNGFINKNEILGYVSEEEIFELVFGFKPVEYQYVCSPFRADSSPGAYFQYFNDTLKYIDWGDSYRTHYSCFGVVQRYFNIPNFYQTLVFIKERLINGRNLTKRKVDLIERQPFYKPKPLITFNSRFFVDNDRIFWQKYKISKQNLIDDGVFPVSKYSVKNSKVGDYTNTVYTLCYAYTEFESGNKKLYFPYRTGKNRFLSTCTKNDIGGLKSLFKVPQLIITKSYKDYRVLKNKGLNCIWFQNEGSLPDNNILFPIVERYEEVIIFYDNDDTGIKTSNIIATHINNYFPNKARPLYLPIEYLERGVKDPSDMLFKMGEIKLEEFIKENIYERKSS